MNTDKLMDALIIACRHIDMDRLMVSHKKDAETIAAALRAEQAVGEEQIARELLADVFAKNDAWMHAQTVRSGVNIDVPMEMALIAITRALGTARQPENIGEFVIALLIAGGYVTQAKVDEARKIALSHGPYEMAARQSEGVVWTGKVDLICASDAVVVDGLKNPDALFKQRVEIRLAAAPGGEGEG